MMHGQTQIKFNVLRLYVGTVVFVIYPS